MLHEMLRPCSHVEWRMLRAMLHCVSYSSDSHEIRYTSLFIVWPLRHARMVIAADHNLILLKLKGKRFPIALQNRRSFVVLLPKMGAVFGVCTAASCAANIACCCGSAACSLCCKACPTCKNSTSTRIVYSVFLLFGLIISCIVLIPGIRQELDKIPKFCEVWSLPWFASVFSDRCKRYS